jgi:hypothetical protein
MYIDIFSCQVRTSKIAWAVMEIISLVHNQPLTSADEIAIDVQSRSVAAANAVIGRARKLKPVTDSKSQAAAGDVAAELQGLMNGIQTSYDLAKAPYLAASRRLDRIRHEWMDPLEKWYKHVTSLIALYRDEERRKQDLARAEAVAAQRKREQEERDRLVALERAKQEAEMRARMAEEAAERAEAERTAKALASAAEAQQLRLEVVEENLPPVPIQETPKLVGGRDYIYYSCELVDYRQVPPEFFDRCCKVTLRLLPTQQAAAELDKAGKPVHIPGIRIVKETRVSVQGATAIRMVDSGEQL